MKKLSLSLVFAATALLGTHQAMATTIDFDNLTGGTTVTNQYASATFSSDAGNHLATLGFVPPFGSSAPNLLGGVNAGGSINGFAELTVEFTAGVNNLGFSALGVDDTGTIGQIDVYVNNAFLSTVNLVGASNLFAPLAVDLSAFSQVTKIRVYSITDVSGFGYDDFHFNPAAVPEPATLALLAVGLAWFGVRRRV
jgi:hypothetical protein